MSLEGYYTCREAAKELKITPAAIYSAIKKHRLVVERIKEKVLIEAAQLHTYARSRYKRLDRTKFNSTNLSVNQVAKLLKTTSQRVYYNCRTGVIPFTRDGFDIIIKESDLGPFRKKIGKQYK